MDSVSTLFIKDESAEHHGTNLSRRSFIGTLGTASAAAVLTSSGCASPETVYDENDSSGSSKIVPVSLAAQSLVALANPSVLVALVEDFPLNEQPSGISGMQLTNIGTFNTESLDSYAALVEPLAPTLIVDAGWYSTSRQDELNALEEKTGIPYLLLNLQNQQISEAFTLLCNTLGVESDSEKLSCLQKIEEVLELASSVPEIEQFEVLAAGSSSGLEVYGQDTVEYLMVLRSGSIPVIVPGVEASTEVVKESIFTLGECTPEVVFLLDSAAGSDYVTNAYNTPAWNVSKSGRLGYVLPALAGGCAWIADMSPISKACLGAAWIAALLYPQYVKEDPDELVTLFYQTLFGSVPEQDSHAQACNELIEAKQPFSKEQLDQDYAELEERLAAAGNSIVENLQAENDPRNYSDEELAEIYRNLAESFGKEVTQEDIDTYIELIRNS